MTIAHPAHLHGIGLHTGADSRVTLHPAAPGSGIVFRTALGREIPARAEHVVDTTRCTILGKGSDTVSTVEHLLSACAGMEITDLLIEAAGPELPIGDGSAQVWVDLLREAGRVPTAPETPPALAKIVVVTDKDGAFIAAYPAAETRYTVAISFPHPLIGTQLARFDPKHDVYSDEVAGARTFGFIEEVEALRAAGLARGGTLDNAIVVYPDRFSTPLRWENELARHKLLDLMGDLMLSCGEGFAKPPIADIIAVKPSHRLNVALALRIRESVEKSIDDSRVGVPPNEG